MKMDITCPDGHVLEPFKTVTSSFICDVCKFKVLLGTQMYSCKTCSWNSCDKCVLKKKQQTIEQQNYDSSQKKDITAIRVWFQNYSIEFLKTEELIEDFKKDHLEKKEIRTNLQTMASMSPKTKL